MRTARTRPRNDGAASRTVVGRESPWLIAITVCASWWRGGGPVRRGLRTWKPGSVVASGADGVVPVELGLQLLDLGLDLLLGLLAPLLAKPLTGFRRGRLLRVLCGGDLRLDLLEGTAQDGAAEWRHRSVDDFGGLFVQVGDEGSAAGSHGARDVAQRGLRVVGVVHVEQRADQETGGAADEHAERTAEDADEQADDPAGGGSLEVGVADVVLDVEATVFAAHDHCCAGELQLTLIVELLEQRQCLVCLGVVAEVDCDYVLHQPFLHRVAGALAT